MLKKILIILLFVAVIAVIAGFIFKSIKSYKKLKKNKSSPPDESQFDFDGNDSEKNRLYAILRKTFDSEKTIIPNVKISELMATENKSLEHHIIDFVVFAIGKKPILLVEIEKGMGGTKTFDETAGIARLLKCHYIRVEKDVSDEEFSEKLGKISE